MDDSPWNSLEVVKIVIGFLTPLILVGLGFVINRAARRVEDAQWANRKLIEQRLEVLGRQLALTFEVGDELLNDLHPL